ncbi:hypothetical protein ACJ73_00571 [Blastomyces percursus]|uniref:Amino acid permease/ SLC12A domain-containing protein n=1 Tax=Blastomyces percursus TaxID=1658174 RepID=A0A1J9QHR0_9EURO|nr:hypothetical protein ACJ73_00571 [Blastomyces percursus]
MALGGIIGTGLFVGSGLTLHTGDSAVLLGAYIFIGLLVFGVVRAISAIATYLPVHGGTMSYYARSRRFYLLIRPELIVTTAEEMELLPYSIPRASRRVFYRLLFFHTFGALAIGVICPSNLKALKDGWYGAASPSFVLGIKNAGIRVLDSIINSAILLPAWSSGNSYLYVSS